jgi:hypothetical protein
VVPGLSWNSLLPSKASACFMGGLQTLARVAVKPTSSLRCHVERRETSLAYSVEEDQSKIDPRFFALFRNDSLRWFLRQ